MGPIRRRLTVPVWTALACMALPEIGAAQSGNAATVCPSFRPGWDGTPVTAWAEMVALFGTPISLVLLLGTALAVRFKSAWGALAAFVGWSFAVAAVTFLDPTGGQRAAAAAEGCIGSPTLYIGVVAVICIGMMIYLNHAADRAEKT